ncbi:unnamed protein product [Camellia sinensis]
MRSQGTYYTIHIEVIASFDTQNMKYLEYTPLDRINDFLSHVNLGERTIKGCLEAYSCKHTGTDKKLSLSLEHEILDYLGKSSDNDSPSPVEYLCSRSRWGMQPNWSTKNLKRRVMGNATVSFMGGMATHYNSLNGIGSVVKRFDRQFRELLLLEELRVQVSPFPKTRSAVGAVKAHQFFMEENWDSFKQIFDAYMFEASKSFFSKPLDFKPKPCGAFLTIFKCEEAEALWGHTKGGDGGESEWVEANEGSPLLDTLYKALDEVVKLAECEIYSYDPESDADPFLERGAIWSFTFFFYNRKLKRVVSFRFSCLSNLVADGFVTEGLCNEEDGEIFDDMDLLSCKSSFKHPKIWKCPRVRSQSFHDEGNSENIVDANLSVLREKIREVRKKERLENMCCSHENGWNYKTGYDKNHKSHEMLSESIELLGLVSSSLGLVFLSGSFCIFLVSFVVHLYK